MKAPIVSLASLSVTNSRGKVLLSVVPNVHPATRVIARKDYGDESLVEYVQVITILRDRQDFTNNSFIHK